MGRRRFILGAVVLLAAVCGVAFLALQSREPSYHGRRLGQWLQDLDSSQPLVQAQAAEAVRQMGTNALPWLVHLIQKRDSALKRRVVMVLSRGNSWNLPGAQHLRTAAYEHYQASHAFRVLGRSAEPAVPAIAAVLSNGQASLDIAATLPWLGPEGVRALTNALARAGGARFVQICMAMSVYAREFELGAMPKQDQEFVFQSCIKAAVSRLADQDFFVRSIALGSLEHLPVQPEVLVPVLTNNLARQDLFPHWSELEALGRFGPAATAAVPALVNYAREAKVTPARDKAIEALEKIDPEAAARVRTK